ncbi:MAG: hypothetical protein JOS17DRAFT_758109 [Linnemannia elongata]|nr:MAG: hypothetical protein JOS17DRAFT_758109 [Linnemannia elongata]
MFDPSISYPNGTARPDRMTITGCSGPGWYWYELFTNAIILIVMTSAKTLTKGQEDNDGQGRVVQSVLVVFFSVACLSAVHFFGSTCVLSSGPSLGSCLSFLFVQ